MSRHCCEQMRWAITEKETGIVYYSKLSEYGLDIRDGGLSYIQLNYCPWCGVKLPLSKRTEWFERLEAMNVDPWNDEVPEEFQTEAWYANKKDHGA